MLLKPFFLIGLFVAILTLSNNIHGQRKVYEAFMKGDKVGEMAVVREVNDESDKISVVSHIEAHMIVKIRVDYESHSTYMDGKLMEAEAISKTNGHEHSITHTILKSDGYQITKGRKTHILSDLDLHGGDLFYFEEPQGINKVYALSSGSVLEVEKEGMNDYYFEEGGKKELHRYQNGELIEVHLEHKFYTIVFKLKR